MKNSSPAVTASLLAVALAGVCAGQPSLRAVRFWTTGEVTRIAIETDEPVEFRSERLANPYRIFFDLPGVLPAESRKVQVIPVGGKLVRQIRVALTQPTVTRVVLDLDGPAEFTASQLANPDRLIVEVRPAVAAPAAPPQFEPPPAAPEPSPVLLAPPKLESAPAAAAVPKPPPPPERAQPKPEVARAASRDSSGNRSLIRALGLKVERVVIDPGHGGHDTGTIGPSGLAEKDLVLDVALRLGKLITDRMGSEVVHTRTEDVFVPLETRNELANEKQADLFLSIHANSSRLAGITGVETFYLNFTTSADALEVAARENAGSSRTIHELQDLVLKITKKEKVQESREFAARMQRSLCGSLRTRDRGVKKAPFVVLAGAQMPSVLIEIAFLSNPAQERLLKRPDYRQRIAEALYKGLSQYAGGLSHFQVASSKPR